MESRKDSIFPYVVIAILGILLFIRNYYSFSWSDESFYLTVVHRFFLGEKMFADEWFHAVQLSTPLLLPFYGIYQWLTGGNEGVYLYFRLIYWFLSMLITILLYRKLKQYHGATESLICAVIYQIYSRANIGGLSYYNITLSLATVSAILVYDSMKEGKKKHCKMFAVGIFSALTVVVTPHFALPYLVVCAYLLIRKKYREIRKYVLTALGGTVFTAMIYMTYVLSKVSLYDIFANVPHILNEPEMQNVDGISLVLVIPLMCVRVVWRYKWTIGLTVLLLLYVLQMKRTKQKFTMAQQMRILCLNCIIFAVNFFLSSNLIGCINIACMLFLIPVICMYLDRRQLDKSVIIAFGGMGFGVALAFSLSSDTGLDAMASGFVLIAMGAVLLAYQCTEIQKNRAAKNIVFTVLIFVLVQSTFLRLFSVYRDAPIWELNTRIEEGPAKYLYTTQEHAKQYDTLRAAIDTYVREEDRVFYSAQCFWSYLCTDNEYGTPSSWRVAMDSPRLEEYYELYPDKLPTCVFVLSPEYGSFESSMIQGNEKSDEPNVNRLRGYLYDYIMENDYEMIETEAAMIFRSK